jgi:hypothetical protein
LGVTAHHEDVAVGKDGVAGAEGVVVDVHGSGCEGVRVEIDLDGGVATCVGVDGRVLKVWWGIRTVKYAGFVHYRFLFYLVLTGEVCGRSTQRSLLFGKSALWIHMAPEPPPNM